MAKAIALALALAATLAPQAAAATFPGGPPDLTAGPFIGGDGLVWTQTPPGQHATDVYTQAPGAPARIVGTIPLSADTAGDQLEVRVSGGYLAYGYVAEQSGRYGPEPVASVVAAGPLAGPYKPLASCSHPPGSVRFSLAGGLLGYTPSCTPGSPLDVLDLATGTDQPFAAPPNSAFVLAGDYLAVRTAAAPDAVTVYRRSSGEALYTAGPPAPIEVGDFDLQADGKLAAAFVSTSTAAAGGALIAWFSPADPTPHVVPLPQTVTAPHLPVYTLPLRIAGDRIVFSRPESPCSYQGVSDLLESDLRGNVSMIDRVTSGPPAIPFDFDGATVAWLGNPEGVATLATDDLTTAALPAAAPVAPNCPTLVPARASITSRALRIGPSGARAHLVVRCLGRQCALHVDVRTAHRVRLTPHARPALLRLTRPGLNLAIYPGRSGTFPIVLTRRQQRLLRRVRHLSLAVTVTDYLTHAELARTTLTLSTR